MLFTVTFSVLLLYQQHRIAVRGAKIAIEVHEETARAIKMGEILANLNREAKRGEVDSLQVSRFKALTQRIKASNFSQEFIPSLLDLDRKFDAYTKALNDTSARNRNFLLQVRYEDVAAALGAFIEINQNAVYRMADHLRAEQVHSLVVAIVFLGAFILVLGFAGFKLISTFMEPLSSLARSLDDVDIESDLPTVPQVFHHRIPEVTVVAKSFERLLHRLRGYRTLNVRRLLIEKRRADIVAACISDGIFLLRDQEILYVNPIGEKILAVEHFKGKEAVLSAVSQTIPVEFTLEAGDRKSYYLLQAYPISYDLIEEVEHSSGEPAEQIAERVLERFKADIMVVAQDVTLVRESQEAKSHFIGTLSHEIKTPVTSLTMATRLLKKSLDEIPNPMHKALISTCVEDVDRMRVLVENLLTISDFDTLTHRLEIQYMDIVKLIKHSVQSFQAQAASRGVDLGMSIESRLRSVIVPVDPPKIAWALSNLLTNALRHTPQGGKVRLVFDATDDYVEVRIQDTGPGIEKQRQERIFDKYNPIYDIRVARSGSIGMGLAIAREIVSAHEGRIWVTSEPGKGAQFCFTLPLKRQRNPKGLQNGLDDMQDTMTTTKGATRGTTARG